MTKLWLIEYESSQWCGGSSHVVVRAETSEEAEIKAEYHMADAMRELFSDEYADLIEEEGEDADQDCPYTINTTEEFDETHESWQFFQMSSQSEFYPIID
jgi:hypothetical protein